MMAEFPEVQRLVDDISLQASQNNVRLILKDAPKVNYPTGGSEVNGYFVVYDKPTLAVAVKRPVMDWVMVLAHEGSHMEQWIERSPYWTESFVDGREAIDHLDDWCRGKDMSEDELADICRRARDVEWDCEKRTIEKAKKYALPVNIKEETQKANSYILLYSLIRHFRRWPDIRPYEVEDIWSVMPDNFEMDYGDESLKDMYRQMLYH
jgi:hypothetical protein